MGVRYPQEHAPWHKGELQFIPQREVQEWLRVSKLTRLGGHMIVYGWEPDRAKLPVEEHHQRMVKDSQVAGLIADLAIFSVINGLDFSPKL